MCQSIVVKSWSIGLVLGIALLADAAPPSRPKDMSDAEYNHRVLETKVDFEYKDKPIEDVLAELGRLHGANFVLGAEWRGRNLRVDAQLKNVKLANALSRFFDPGPVMQLQSTPVVVGNTIFIASENTALSLQLEQRIGARYDKVPFEKVIRDLAKKHGVNVIVDPQILKTKSAETPITLNVDGMRFEAVIALASEMAGLAAFQQHRALYVSVRGAKISRVQFLAASLARPVPEMDKGDQPLPLLLEVVMQTVSPPEAQRDPSKRVIILVDAESLKKGNEPFDVDRCTVKFISRLANIPLETILDLIGEQIGGMVLVREEFIEFVGYAKACAELKIDYKKDKPLPRLVHRFWKDVPLEQALQQLADRYNRNIVLSPEAKAKKKDFAVTARLVNVPLETAVEIVADLAELKLVRKANVLMVTTKEQAAELNAEQENRLKAEKALAEKEKAKEEKKKN